MSTGKRIPEGLLCDRIDAVTADDLQRIAQEFICYKPSVAIIGDVPPSTPAYGVIEDYFKGIATGIRGSSTP